MWASLIDLINMQTSLICKLFSLDSVAPLWCHTRKWRHM